MSINSENKISMLSNPSSKCFANKRNPSSEQTHAKGVRILPFVAIPHH